jgi:hypothetical protein
MLAGAYVWRVFTRMASADDLAVLQRALPGPVAWAVTGAMRTPLLPAVALGLIPILAAWFLPRLGAAGSRVETARIRGAVAWVWLGSAAIAAVSLASDVTATKVTLAALGYVLAWPFLISLVVVLAMRRVTPLALAWWTTVAAAAGLLLRALPLGLPGQNSWSYWAMLPHRPIGSLILGGIEMLGALMVLIGVGRLRSAAACRWGLVGLAIASLLLLRGLARLEHYGPDKHPAALASEINTSYFQVGAQLGDSMGILRDYPQRMPPFPMHARTHPPGWPLLFHHATRAGEISLSETKAAVVAWLLGADVGRAAQLASSVAERPLSRPETRGLWLVIALVLAGTLVAPALVYGAVREHAEPPTALAAASAATLIAAPLLFFPDVDGLSPALAVLTVWAWIHSERRHAALWALVSGALLTVMVMLSFGHLALLAVPILEAVLSWRRRRPSVVPESTRFLCLVAPLVIAVAALRVAGIDLIAMFAEARRQHHEILAHRTRGLWLFLDLQEVVVFFGIPLAAWIGSRIPWRSLALEARERRCGSGTALLAATLLTILLLDLSGETKGEAGRIWMGFLPLLVVGSAAVWERRSPREWALLCVASVGLLAVLKGFYVFVWLYTPR